MSRSTKPLRVDKNDAELVQSLAEEHGTRPAEVFGEILAEFDLEQVSPEPEQIGSCPVCGYQFDETEVKDKVLSCPQVKCPDPENRHSRRDRHRFKPEDLDDV